MPGKVKVKILAGRNLPVMDRGSDTTDAYVEIKIGSITHKTDVCRKSLHPQWNSDWYRFEIDDADLQDEPLQIRLMDHDTYSANDAIGKVSISLNPLLLPPPAAPDGHPVTSHSGKGVVMAGWIPVFDTMHGIRGEVNVIVKVDLFSDVNKFRQSSCGIQFFHSPIIPHGYHAQVIHGFVDELVVNDDPEYQWIDKIRTPRASNEARQIVFLKLSGQVQRKIGLKALDLGANAVIGYTQCFDLEGDVGVVARGIGTAVTLVKLHDFTPQPNIDAALAEDRALKYLKFLAADSGNPSKFDPSFNTSYYDVNKLLDNILPEKQLELIPADETLTPTIMGSHFPGVGKPKLRKSHKKHPILFVSQSQMMSNRNISLSSDLNTSGEGIDGDSLRIRLEQEDNRGEVAGNRFSRGIKTSKNILSKKMTALKAKLSDSQLDGGSGQSSLNSSFSDLSTRSSLADLRSEVKKVKKFKPKFKRSSSDGTGMAALLVRSVMQVHTSLDCIVENHDSPAQSPQASMRRESRTKIEKVSDVGSSSEELQSLNQKNISTEVPPIVVIDENNGQKIIQQDFIPSTEELPISSDSLSSESSSSDCELSEDGDTDTKLDLAATPDTISLVVKTVLAQENNKAFTGDWIKPVGAEHLYAGIQSDGEAVLETTLGHTIHAVDVLKTKYENEDDNYGENIHPDTSNQNLEEDTDLTLPPVIDHLNLKNTQGLVSTAMQAMLMERVNLLGSITDTPTKSGKNIFTFETTSHSYEDKSFSEPTSPSCNTEEQLHVKKHDHGFKHLFEKIGSAMHTPPVLKKRFSFSHHDKKVHDIPATMSSSESNPTLTKDHSDLRHMIFKPIFNNGRNISEMELPTIRMIKGEKKHGSSPSLLKSLLKDNKEHKSMFHRPRFISFSHSKSYDPDLLLSKNKKHGSTPSLHKEIHKHKHFFHRPKFLFTHSHKTASSEPTSPKNMNLKHSDGLIGTAIQTMLMEKVNIMGEIIDKSPIIGDEQHLNSPPVDRETVLGTTFSSPDLAPTTFQDRPWFTPCHTPTRDTVLGSPFMSLVNLKQEYPNIEMKDSPFSSQISLGRDFKVDSPKFYENNQQSLLDTAMETILMDRVHTLLATSPQATPPIVQRQISLQDVSEKLKQLEINREQNENIKRDDKEILKDGEYIFDKPQLEVINSPDEIMYMQIDAGGEIADNSNDSSENHIDIQSIAVTSDALDSVHSIPPLDFKADNKSEESINPIPNNSANIHDNKINLEKTHVKNKTLHASISDNSILCATNLSLHGSIPILSSEQPRPNSPNKNQGHHRTESAGKPPQSPARGINANLNSVHRRSSDSDLSVTPKGLIRKRNSLTSGGGERSTQRQSTAGGVIRPSMQQDNLDMLEYPFLTMEKYPVGFIQHIGGVVSARSVKLLERVPNPDEPELRDTWWAELRMEIRSHARALACNVVLGYSEVTTISDDICVLSANGTAAVINLQYSKDTTDVANGKTTHAPSLQTSIPKELMTTSLDRQEFESDKESTRVLKQQLDGKDSIRSGATSGDIVEEENNASCSAPSVVPKIVPPACAICHIPYSQSTLPFRVNLMTCAVCGKGKVPDVLLCTVEVPDGLQVTGRGCLLQAHVLRPKRDLRSELNAREISDGLPFLEYELHRLLISKLKVKGMNAIFGLKATVAIGERMIATVATGTAVFLTALPPPSAPIVTAGNSWSDLQRLGELQRALQETVDKNREVYQLKPLAELTQNIEGSEEIEEEQVDLDFAAGNKDTCILEVDDAEDLEVFSLLMEPRPPDGFHVVNTQAVPGLQGLEVVRNPQTFTQVWRTKLPQNQPATYFPQHFQKLLQSVYYKLRCMIPCAICELRFRLDLPEPDEIQLLVTGMALGLGEPSKINKYKRKMMVHSLSREAVKKSDDDLIFSLEEEQLSDMSSTSSAKPRSRSPSGLKSRNSSTRLSRHMPSKERYGVDITPLSYVPGGRIDRYLGNLNFFFIRESTSVRENGGISGFIHSFITEILAIVRAHVTALGGNAMVAYYMTELILGDNPHKNQGQCLVSVGGDVVSVSYYPDE